ncbi:DUF3006 domain-containing protein [Guptibacillus algicola]|uniref:DUF3006 domain-containing protein n=1 Tax=Guptibacillus algicola TaxID=225844 RepID=UPI001CD6E1CF|nr:DUF3006 domain-containing protein [Alkalihalobacillus algicola]MCA0987492.1 DUF3006 domain-containing protein [Alkalihalobacillus algicola]
MRLNGKYTLDRFEGNYGVLLYRQDETQVVDVETSLLPSETKEGDILHIEFSDKGEVEHVDILKEETKEARRKAEEMLNKLRKK